MERDQGNEFLQPTIGFGDVVLRTDKNNERSVVVDLPDPTDGPRVVNVFHILTDEPGFEMLEVGGTADVSGLVRLRGELPWTPERIARGSVRRYGINDDGLITEMTASLELEAQKPRISIL